MLFVFPGFSTDGEYAVSKIDADLLKGANAVIRLHETTVEIQSIDRLVRKERLIVTILNSKAPSRLRTLVEHYAPGVKVKTFKAALYDKFGHHIRDMKGKEVHDNSAISDFSIYEDDRVKYFKFDEARTPYTVEFISEVSQDKTYNLPSWHLVEYEGVAVEKSRFIIKKPADFDIITSEILHGLSGVERTKSPTELAWQISNIRPLGIEEYGPATYDQLPKVMFAPKNFSLSGYEGSKENWAALGDFYYNLNKNRNELEDELANSLRADFMAINDKKERIRAIYKYVQNNTRYVSVQLGIGGLQCFPASYVASKGYGDCKALSNFTKTLLELCDIKSHEIIIQNETKPVSVKNDFVWDPFNHVILGVPLEKDTLFLECTSQILPMGYIGASNMNRRALWVEAEGKSKLVKMPALKPDGNLNHSKALVTINRYGDASIEIEMRKTGFWHRHLRALKLIGTDDQIDQQLSKIIDLANYDMESYEIDVSPDKPECTLRMKLMAKNVAKVAGGRLFLKPNVFNVALRVPEKYNERRFPLVFQNALMEIDELEIVVPENYKIEFLPESVAKDLPGISSYSVEYKLEENKLSYLRTFVRHSGQFEKSQYKAYRNFAKLVGKADQATAVFVK